MHEEYKYYVCQCQGGSVVAGEDEQNLANLEISEDPTADPEADRSRFLAILVECLAKLNAVSCLLPQCETRRRHDGTNIITWFAQL